MNQAVICTLPTTFQAEEIVDALKNAGFRSTKISVLMPNLSELREMNQASQGGIRGTSSIVGGALGWLAGIEAIIIPGIGPLVAAGPIVSMLCDTPGGMLKGSITSVLIDFGISEMEAKQYNGKLCEGNVLLLVHTGNSEEVKLVEYTFKAGGIKESSRSGEEAVRNRQ